MNPGRQVVILLLALGLLFTAGCAKRTPKLPAQAKAPAEPLPSTLPAEIAVVTLPPPPPPQLSTEAPPAELPKPKPEVHHRRRHTQHAQNSSNSNTSMAAAQPPDNPAAEAPDLAIGADVSTAQLFLQKQTTAKLLEETEKSLNAMGSSLSHEQEEIVGQIRSYVIQSRNATKDGDFERAYNLATKAHLLSAALIKK
jgi:uncharacterized protein involved in copper resistance